MTTAARPTWLPAMGGHSMRDKGVPSSLVSAKDLAAHTKLKYRQIGQNAPEEIERKAKERKELKRELVGDSVSQEEAGIGGTIPEELLKVIEQDRDDSEVEDDESESSESSDEDEDEDTEELLRELAKIKAEREKERLEKEAEREREERERLEMEAMAGNPLIEESMPTGVKRRWDADIIFRNQARTETEPKKRFINDLTRSDFHRKFMSKYIK